MKENPFVVIPTACAETAPTVHAAPLHSPAPLSYTGEPAAFAPARSLALMVTEEEAEALMAVLLLAPLEGGRTGDAMERILSRLADVQRAFARAE